MSDSNDRLRFAPTRWEDLGKSTPRTSSGTRGPSQAEVAQWQAELREKEKEMQSLQKRLRSGALVGREAAFTAQALDALAGQRQDILAKINAGREIKTSIGDVGREIVNAPFRGAVGTVLSGVAGAADFVGGDETAESVRSYRNDVLKKYGPPESASQNHLLRYGGQAGEAIGSTVPYLAAGLPSAVARGGVAAMAFGGGVDTQDERVKQAREQGLTVSSGQEVLAETIGGAVGLVELLPVQGLLARVPKGYGPKVIELVGQRFATTAVGRAMAQGGQTVAGKIAGSAIEEGVQEAAAGVAQDLIELGVYNPNVEVGQSALQDFALGAVAGGVIRGGREAVGRFRGEDMSAVEESPMQVNQDRELLNALEARFAEQNTTRGSNQLEYQGSAALEEMGDISARGMNFTPEQVLDYARNNEQNPRIADIMSQPVSDVTKVEQVARIMNEEEAARVEPEAIRRISGMIGGTNSVSKSRQMIGDELAKISPEIVAQSKSLSAIAKAIQSEGSGKQFVNGLRDIVNNYQPTARDGQTFIARPERGGEGSVVMTPDQVADEAQREREAQQAFRMAGVRQARFDTATGQGTQREDLRAGAPEPQAQFFLNPEFYGEELGGTVATIVGAEGGRVRIQYESPNETDENGAPVIISEDVDPASMFDRVVRGTARMTQELAGNLRRPKAGTGTDLNPRRSVDRTSTRAIVPTNSGVPETVNPTRFTGFAPNEQEIPAEQEVQNAQVKPVIEGPANVEGIAEGPNEISGTPAAPKLPAPQEAPQAEAPAKTEEESAAPDKRAARDKKNRVAKHIDNIDDKVTNLDRKGIVRYADKVHKEGLIDDADLAEIKRMSKDKDMGPEDIGPELISMLEIKAERDGGDVSYSGRTSKRKKRTYATGAARPAERAEPEAEAATEPAVEERRPENPNNNIDDVGRGVSKASDSVSRNPTPRKDEIKQREKKIDYDAVIKDRLDQLAERGSQGRVVASRLRSLLKQNNYTPRQLYYAFQMGEVVSRVLPQSSKVDILFVPSVKASDPRAAAASGIDLGAEASGSYQAYEISQNGFRGLITLSLSDSVLSVARENAAHEAFHVIQDMMRVYDPQMFDSLTTYFRDGMTIKDLDPSILRVLKTRQTEGAGSVYDTLIEDFGDTPLSNYEAQAVAFGALLDAKDRGIPMKGLKASFIRFVDMLDKMITGFQNIFRKDGSQTITVAEFFDNFRTGKAQEGFDVPAPLAGEDSAVQYSGRKDTGTGEFNKNIKAPKLSSDDYFAQPDVKQGTMSVSEAAMEMQARTLSILGRPITAAGQQDGLLARTVAHEVKAELARSGKRNASGWYTEEMRKATAVASLIHPEIATDVSAQLHFTAALAITSQNQSVDNNAVYAERWYEHYKKNGKFPENEGWGKAASSIMSNAKLFNMLVDRYGAEAVSKFFATKYTVRELKAAGFKNVSGAAEEMVYGSAVLGPKIGFGFYSNLNGRYDPVTIDMWFMRTWGRMTGDLIGADPELIEEQEDRLRKALDDEGRPTNAYGPELLEIAREESKAFEKDFKVNRAAYDSGEKEKSEVALAAQRLISSFDDTKDAPKADWQRTWIRDVVAQAQQILQKDGINITNADLQAILWYPEKRLWSKKFGVREKGKGADDAGSAGETSYYDEFVRIAKQRGFKDADISAAIQPTGGRGQGSGGVLGGQAVNGQAGGQPSASDGFDRRDGKRFIQAAVIARLNKEFPILDGTSGRASGQASEHVSRKAGGNLARSLEGRVPVVATYSHSAKVKNALAAAGIDAPKFLELTSGPAAAKLYRRLITDAKKANKAGGAVYVYDQSDYEGMRLFLTEDGLSGFALKDDDLVSVFKHPKSEARNIAISLARMAVWNGARRLDAYDTVLPYLYSTAGFRVASRVKWDDTQADKSWNKAEFADFNNGEPDVVFMYHDPLRTDLYSEGEGQLFEDYNDAVEAQKTAAGNVRYSGRKGRAVYTKERIERVIKDHAYSSNENSSKGWLAFMSPDQFLGLTLSKDGRDLLATMDPKKTRARPLNVDDLAKETQSIFLEVADPYMASGVEQPRRVMGHEGRHRMTALKAAGIDQVPVIIRRQDGRAGDLEVLNNITLAPQRSRADQYSSGDTQAVIAEAVPINYANADRVREMMSGGDIRFSGRRGRDTGGVSQSMMDKVVAEEPNAGVFGKFLDKMVGRVGNESRRRALVRNVVNDKDGTFVLDRLLDAAIRGVDPADGRVPVDGSSVGRMMEMASQSTGVMQAALELGPPVFDGEITTISDEISGLFDIFAPIGEDRAAAFQTYAVARRESDLRRRGRVGFTEITDAEIAQTLRDADDDFADVFDAYQEYNGAIIDYAVDTGLLTEELGEKLKDMDYVPYYRAYEQDDGELDVLGPKMQAAINNPKSGLDLKLKGGSSNLGNLYENIIRNTQSIISAARKNLALQEAADAVDALNELGVDDIGRRVATADGKGIMRLRVDGKPVYYQIEDPAVWAAIASLGPQQMNIVVEAFAKFANVLRTGVTLATSFMVANLWRGKVSAYVTTDANLSLGIDTFKGMKDAYQNGESTRIIKANTGIGGYTYGMGEKDFANEIRRRYRRQEGGGYGFTRDWLDRLKGALVAAEKIGEATELAERVKLYNDIIANGGNAKTAAYEAMNLTNFGRKGAGQGYIGATMNVLIPMIPFLNARIQGLYRIAENQQNEATIMGLRKKVLLRGMLYTMASSAIYALFSDDDRWEEETVEAKMLYDIIYIGDKTIYLPRPFEVGTIFGSLPVAMYDYVRDQDGDQVAKKFVFAFTNTFAMNPIPQGVKPTLEAFVNYSFFRGGPIDTMADQNLPAGMRYDERTTETAKAIGGVAGVSPKKVDYVLNGYLGTLGAGMISGIDSVLSGVGVIPKKAGGLFGDPYHIADTIASASGMTRFVKDSDRTTSRFVSDFYELKKEADQANRAHKKLVEEGRMEEALEFAEENKFSMQARTQLSRIGREITKVNKEIDKVEVDPKMTPAEKQLKLKPLLRKRKDLARSGYDYARGMRNPLLAGGDDEETEE